ncbi:acyltransferase family protein [Verrucomicrobia bacterium]|nr:acyltransferase family protein [Verrucomicrobiota bacterium]
MTAKRYHDLDALRAFAMLLGILLHGLLSFIGLGFWPAQDVNQSEYYFLPLMFIHGFRMSLFFFVSGFFTMMMWQRRGTAGLLVHRFKRIVLPFFVFGFLVFPMLNNMKAFAEWMGEGREERVSGSSEEKEAVAPKYTVPDDLGGAARQGDLDAIVKFLNEGADIDGKYDMDFTPLHWAAAMGEPRAIALLADKGADLNSRDGHQSTPILLAAFFGRPECVRILLEKGADPELANKDGSRPLEAMKAGREITKWVATDILKVPMVWSEVREGRKEVRKLLGGGDLQTVRSGEDKLVQQDDWFARNYMPDGSFITHHLWFLYDLVYLVLAFVLVASSFKYFPLAGLPKWLAQSPLRLLWLVPLTFWAQYSMGGGGEDGLFGPSTAVWLEPDWIKLSYYGIFFGYGALCFQHKGFHQKVGRHWPFHLLVSVLIFLAALSLMERTDLEFRYEIISLCSALFVWLMIFGLIGVFRKFFSGESPQVRFVSDSAYWLYIAHLPLIQVVQIWVSDWPFPSLFKLAVVCFVTTGLLLISYRYLIRHTPVGTMLNGKMTKTA